MKFNVNVFVGLAFCVVVLGFFGVFQRVLEIRETWRSDDLYTAAKHSTYSVATSSTGWHTSNNSGVSAISVRSANSMFRHRPVFSYAPATVPAYSQSPIGGMPSNSVASPIYTTSSATMKSFGGGNISSSAFAGAANSASPASAATPVAASVGMPSVNIPVAAYGNTRLNTNELAALMFGDVALSTASAYAGIGNTTGGASRGISGRKDGAVEDSWLQWLAKYGTGYGSGSGDDENGWTYTFDYYQLDKAYQDYVTNYWDDMWGEPPTFDQWLTWFQGNGGSHDYRGNTYNWVPVGDYYPLLILAMLYVGYVAIRRRKSKISENNI